MTARLAAIQRQQEEHMRRYGWYAHHVFDYYQETIYGCAFLNAHTHGLTESWQHPELQVVLPLPSETVQAILSNAVALIREGTVLQDGMHVEKVIQGYPVLVRQVEVDGEVHMRLILPDPAGRFPGDPGCDPEYALQAAELTRTPA